MRKEKLIDIIVANRTEKALDRLLENNKKHKAALKEQDEAFRIQLSRLQKKRSLSNLELTGQLPRSQESSGMRPAPMGIRGLLGSRMGYME